MAKQKIGRAYAFFDYNRERSELEEEMEDAAVDAQFPGNFNMRILRDNSRSESEKLPSSIAELAKTTEIYGAVRSDCSPGVFERLSKLKPKSANELRYLVIAEDQDSEESCCRIVPKSQVRIGQGRTNKQTASMLHEILNILSDRESRKPDATGVFRGAVFYQDSRGKAQAY
jgi:hypothetical protein